MKSFKWILALGLSLAACGADVPRQPERLPDDEIPAFTEAVGRIAPYVRLCDSVFTLTVSASQAARLGIPEKYYERMRQELEYTNYLIREHNRNGQLIELPQSAYPLIVCDGIPDIKINKN